MYDFNLNLKKVFKSDVSRLIKDKTAQDQKVPHIMITKISLLDWFLI